jgi:hypothetical protein
VCGIFSEKTDVLSYPCFLRTRSEILDEVWIFPTHQTRLRCFAPGVDTLDKKFSVMMAWCSVSIRIAAAMAVWLVCCCGIQARTDGRLFFSFFFQKSQRYCDGVWTFSKCNNGRKMFREKIVCTRIETCKRIQHVVLVLLTKKMSWSIGGVQNSPPQRYMSCGRGLFFFKSSDHQHDASRRGS